MSPALSGSGFLPRTGSAERGTARACKNASCLILKHLESISFKKKTQWGPVWQSAWGGRGGARVLRWVQGWDHLGHPKWGTRHLTQTTTPLTSNQPRASPQHSPFQGKPEGYASPARALIKTPGMSRPLLIPIKSIQSINYQIGR